MRVFGLVALLLVAVGVQGHEGTAKQMTGFYAGLMGGSGSFQGKPDYGDRIVVEQLGDRLSAFGGYVGYRSVNGVLSFSIEAEYMELKGESKIAVPALSFTMENRLEDTWAVSALLGYLASDNVEVYVRGGYGKTSTSALLKDANNELRGNESYKHPIGGIGFRFLNDSPLALRMEYRHYFNEDYKAYDVNNAVDIESNTDLFLIALEYSF